MWRLPGGFLPFSGFPVLPLRCSCLALGFNLWLPPDALLCENILSFDFVESSGSLDACRPFFSRTLGNGLFRTGLYYSLPCVIRRARARSHHGVDRYSGRPSGIAPLLGLDRCTVLCAEPVLLAG